MNGLKEIRENFDKLKELKSEKLDELNGDELWAYSFGRLYQELISLSKSNKKDTNLMLERIINVRTSKQLSNEIRILLEAYQYNGGKIANFYSGIISSVLTYEPKIIDINKLKLYIYAGYFDNISIKKAFKRKE
jgi:hypothetical protein